MSRLLSAAALAAIAAASAHAQPSDDSRGPAARSEVLRVQVSGASSNRGHVRVDVCARSEFLSECRYSGSAPAKPGVTIVEVRDLPPGVYAVQAYDDRNDNQKVDRNVLGLPTEGVGFSNDAAVGLNGPRFKDAQFTYPGGEQTIALKLRRFVP